MKKTLNISVAPQIVWITTEVVSKEERESIKAELKQDDALIQCPKWVIQSHVTMIKGLKCYENIRELILNGIPTREVARQIHLFGELRSVAEDSVSQYLEHYKASIPKALMVQRQNPFVYQQTAKKLENDVNVLDSMGKLFKMMEKRIELAVSRENTVGFLLPNVERQFEVAMEILESIAKAKEKTGFDQTEKYEQRIMAKQVDWDSTYGKPGINKVMNDPTARTRMVRFIENMTHLFGGMDKDKQAQILESARKRKMEMETITTTGVSVEPVKS